MELPSQNDLPAGTTEDWLSGLTRRTSAVGERISLALANLRLREVLRSQSIRDPLTGLFNRRYMEVTLDRELQHAARNNQSLAILMIDIDHFKDFNDTFGHQAGDALLRAIGGSLNHGIRGQDIACRFGGEEFLIILTDTSLDIAHSRAQTLCDEVTNLVIPYLGHTLGKITISVGIASFPKHGATPEELIRNSDQALYRAKKQGRNRVIMA
jgi:diguanylate cyclase (GGDEF)-like protein